MVTAQDPPNTANDPVPLDETPLPENNGQANGQADGSVNGNSNKNIQASGSYWPQCAWCPWVSPYCSWWQNLHCQKINKKCVVKPKTCWSCAQAYCVPWWWNPWWVIGFGN
ncbi:hypothetical protein G9A89_010702 [Geosiphon pyriformis]|nr:hypothetical protein G9A89_010702 [Geosiphon pyriformis]